MSKKNSDDIAAEIITVPAEQWLKSEYIVYSLYTIRDRALLAQDGLKPVNRRIVWDMYTMNALPSSNFIKAARVVGDVIGNYHPHGDASVADAMARMAQTFSLRVPLVDKSGSVGFVTGDTPAAPRYWEARMTKAALELVKETREGAISIGKNFDGTKDEPQLLPVRWPNDIINGTKGLAVGFASNIPAHNPDETMKAAIAMLRKPGISVDEILKIMPGPDFPTGGEILEIDGIKEYFETGSGRFTVRGRYRTENLSRGRVKITFYELPYGISAEQVITKLHELCSQKEATKNGKKVTIPPNPVLSKGISKIQDLTDKKNGMRLVITTSQGANFKQVLGELFKQTPLQSSFSVNNTVLVDNFPVKLGIVDLLRNFLDFRRDCTTNRCEFRIEKIEGRIHQLDALLSVLLDIDKAISIIRGSDDSETAKEKLIKSFKIDEEQAEYILSMQLRRLTKADSLALQQERDQLNEEKNNLESVLDDSSLMDKMIEKDLRDTMKIISSPRRTVITDLTAEDVKERQKIQAQAAKDANKNLPCYVTRFSNGTLLRSQEPFFYESSSKVLEYGPIEESFKTMTKENIIVVTSDGMGKRIPVSFLQPDIICDAKALGLPSGSSIVGMSKNSIGKKETGLAIVTKTGGIKISKDDYPVKDEFPVISLPDDDEVVSCRWIGGAVKGTFFNIVSRKGNIIRFDASTVNPTGSRAGSVRGMKLKSPDDEVVAFGWTPDVASSILVTSSGKTLKATPLSDIPDKGRGGMGVATQIFRSGESEITSAYIGTNPISCVENNGKFKTIPAPAATKRSSRGTECGFSVVTGSFGENA